jgi:hypothetical protein
MSSKRPWTNWGCEKGVSTSNQGMGMWVSGSTNVGISLVDKLLVVQLSDDRRPNHDRDVGQARIRNVTELIEDVLNNRIS